MKKLLAGALGIFALAMVSCDTVDEFVPPYVPPTEGEELSALNAPKDLSLAVNEGRWVVLTWTGDDTATGYEVEVTPQGEEAQIRSTESMSMGFYDLADATNHTWRVRAKRGDESTEWIVGDVFTTKVFIDQRTDYIGTWRFNGEDWGMSASLSTSGLMGQTMDIDLSQLEEMLPVDQISTIIGILTLSLEKSIVNDPTYSQLIVNGLGPLDEFIELPDYSLTVLLNTNNGKLTMAQPLDQVIPYPGPLPLPISDIPFLTDDVLGGILPDLDLSTINIDITKFEMRLSRFSLELGPLDRNATPYSMRFRGVLQVDLSIETSENMANMLLVMSKPVLNLAFTSSLNKQ